MSKKIERVNWMQIIQSPESFNLGRPRRSILNIGQRGRRRILSDSQRKKAKRKSMCRMQEIYKGSPGFWANKNEEKNDFPERLLEHRHPFGTLPYQSFSELRATLGVKRGAGIAMNNRDRKFLFFSGMPKFPGRLSSKEALDWHKQRHFEGLVDLLCEELVKQLEA